MIPEAYQAYQAIALSLGLGLLVGLQREWKDTDMAGIRTFPLLTLVGTLSALLGGESGWLMAAGLLSVGILLMIANLAKLKNGQRDLGMTTEAAVLVMFLVGAATGVGMLGPAIVTTGVVAVLLHWKKPLHRFVERMEPKDIRGVIHLVLIALVILPLLPDQTYGPYDVLNPYKIWLMVVLIVGISMVAYVAYKLLGASVGSVLGGILGGLISSTATTVSYARMSKQDQGVTSMAALVILIASTIVNVRVLIEVGVVAPRLLQVMLLPMSIMLGLMALESIGLYVPLRNRETQPPNHGNPAQLKPAIIFAALYAVILFVVAAAKEHLGNQALYGVAMISGLTDVDAITLSTARLFQDGRVEGTTAWRVIMIATMSNLVFKASAVAVLGSRQLFLYTAVLFGIAFVGGAAILTFCPTIEIPLSPEWFGSGGSH